jgi:hypothetical protein
MKILRLIKECEWKRDVNGFAGKKVVRHLVLLDMPSHGRQHCDKKSGLFEKLR